MKLSERLGRGACAIPIRTELDAQTVALLREAAELARRVEDAPAAIMDTREFLSLCAPTEEDFPALYALHGQRVRLVPEAGQGVGE